MKAGGADANGHFAERSPAAFLPSFLFIQLVLKREYMPSIIVTCAMSIATT